METTNANYRSVRKTIAGRPATDGAGVKLVRVVGFHDTKDFDPFLMLDAFDSTNPDDYTRGFPFHPHRGIETVTYLVEWAIEHADSLGNAGAIGAGDCQWMTAGSGIIHQEMPIASKRMLGLQLWLNLPATHKMTTPEYRDIRRESIPVIETDDATVRVVSGTYDGIEWPGQGKYVPMTSLDIEIHPGRTLKIPVDPEATAFAYAFSGSASVVGGGPGAARENGTPESTASGGSLSAKQATLFGSGSTITLRAGENGIRFILFAGRPLKEPIAWGGPVVMNTPEELEQAFVDMEHGNFVRK